MQNNKMVVKKCGEVKQLATEVVMFLKDKNITYGEALKALEDAHSFLKRTSLNNQI